MTDWKKQCKDCGDCCGPVPFEPRLWDKHKDKAQNLQEVMPFLGGTIMPISVDIACVFLDRKTKRCLIYDDDMFEKYGVSGKS